MKKKYLQTTHVIKNLYLHNIKCYETSSYIKKWVPGVYLTNMQSTSCKMLGWMKLKPYKIISYADDTTLMAESKEELKSLLMKVKEESENADLKLSIRKAKIMSSDPITSWQTDGGTVEPLTDFVFLGSKITVVGDCSREIKRCLFLGRKAMTNLDSILKSRDIC